MPNLKSATTPPANLKDMVPVSPAAGQPPLPPSDSNMPGFDVLSLAPAPAVFSTEGDRQRQFYRRGVSQYRIPPMPAKANPGPNAAAAGVASSQIQRQVATVTITPGSSASGPTVSVTPPGGTPMAATSASLAQNLDQLPDGTTYGRPNLSRLNAGRPWIDFSEAIHTGKNLDNVGDGSTRFGVVNAGGMKGVASVDGANKALIDFSQAGHTNKTLDNVSNGASRYAQLAVGMSYRPLTNPLTGHDAGANATINIAAFTNRVAGMQDVPCNSGSITGLSYSTLYYVYYDDATLAGGAVTYNAATTKETALNGAGRFFIGSITTPAATAPDTTGNNNGGVGAQSGGSQIKLFNSQLSTATSGGGITGAFTTTNPNNAIDWNLTTFAAVQSTANTNGGSGGYFDVWGIAGEVLPYTSVTLYVRSSASAASDGNQTATCTVAYSTDGGATWTNIYSISQAVAGTNTRALTTDSVSLGLNINPGLIRVRVSCSENNLTASGTKVAAVNFYEAWVRLDS